MADIIVNDDVKMEVVKYFGYENCDEQKNYYLNDAPDDLFKFYLYCMDNGLDACDADRYANLNTVLGYDVGFENFKKIDGYLWCEKDYDLIELFGNESGKEIIKEAVDILNIDIDFSKWKNESEIKCYVYYV